MSILALLLVAAIVCGVIAAICAILQRPWQGAAIGAAILFIIWVVIKLVPSA